MFSWKVRYFCWWYISHRREKIYHCKSKEFDSTTYCMSRNRDSAKFLCATLKAVRLTYCTHVVRRELFYDSFFIRKTFRSLLLSVRFFSWCCPFIQTTDKVFTKHSKRYVRNASKFLTYLHSTNNFFLKIFKTKKDHIMFSSPATHNKHIAKTVLHKFIV